MLIRILSIPVAITIALSNCPPLSAAETQERAELEATIRGACKDIPRSARVFGKALQAMVEIDPPRAMILIRETELLFPRDKWSREVEADILLDPLDKLARKDFNAGLELALERPRRLLPALHEAFGGIVRYEPPAAVRFARRILDRAPQDGKVFLFAVARDYLCLTSEELIRLLPAGPKRAVLLADLGVGLLPRPTAAPVICDAIAEHPEGEARVESRLYRHAFDARPAVSGASPEAVLSLAAAYRDLPSEAGLVGLAVGVAGSYPKIALEIARSIRDEEQRALALAGYASQCKSAPAAREALVLLPSVRQPMWQFTYAEWLSPLLPVDDAVLVLRTGIAGTSEAPDGPLCPIGDDSSERPRAELVVELMRKLAAIGPRVARIEAKRRQSVLGDYYRNVILHCALLHASRSLAESLRWVDADLSDGEEGRLDFALLLADRQPEKALQLVRDLPRGSHRDLVLYALVMALCEKKDPQGAIKLASLFAGRVSRSSAYRDAVFAAWADRRSPRTARSLQKAFLKLIPLRDVRIETSEEVAEMWALESATPAKSRR